MTNAKLTANPPAPLANVTPATPFLDRLFDLSNKTVVTEADLVAEIPSASFGSVLKRAGVLSAQVEGVIGSIRKVIALRCNLDLGFCWGIDPAVLSESDRGIQSDRDALVNAALADALPSDGARRAALSRMRAESCEAVRAHMMNPEAVKSPELAAALGTCAEQIGDEKSASWTALDKRAEGSGAGVQRKVEEARRVAGEVLSPEAKAAALALEAAATPDAKFILLMARADKMLDKMKVANPLSNVVRSDIVDIGNIIARHAVPTA